MDSKLSAAVKGMAFGLNIVLAVAAVFFCLYFVIPWEGGCQAALPILLITWGYASFNIGAIIAKSKVWHIAWTIPAALANLAYLVFGVILSVDLPAVLCLIVLLLITINSVAIAMSFLIRRTL